MHSNRSLVFLSLVLSITAIMVLTTPVLSANSTTSLHSKIFKLLILDSQKGNPYDEVRTSLLAALSIYGYTEGKNLKTTIVFSGNDIKAGERILNDELTNSYDVIFVGGTAATLSAKNALYGKAQRVVFGSPTDPVGIGVIQNFSSKPVANFTGVCYPVPVKTRLKFLRRLMPKARTFGLIYADMPQSHSYNNWIENLLKNDPEFKGIKIIYRSVPLVTGENGDRTMSLNSKKHIYELDSKVDAYIKPCDQMGTRSNFAEIVYNTSRKPLIGLVKDDVMGKWGATATIYPSHESIGNQAAVMIKDLFEGKKVSDIVPEWPHKFGVAVDLKKAKRFGIDIPVELLQMAGENIVR
jgi:putative tryptophan/tyrosine transport system substrate-binding protein